VYCNINMEVDLILNPYNWDILADDNTILCWGRDKSDNYHFIKIVGFQDYCYIEMPDDKVWTDESISKVADHIVNIISQKHNHVVSYEIVSVQKLYSFHPDTLLVIKLMVPIWNTMNLISRLLDNPIIVEDIGEISVYVCGKYGSILDRYLRSQNLKYAGTIKCRGFNIENTNEYIVQWNTVYNVVAAETPN